MQPPPGKEANITFRRPPGAKARRRGSFCALPLPRSRVAASTAVITGSIWMTRSTSASRSTRVTAGRIAPMAQSPLNIGLIGLGTVGSQVADRMLTWQSQLARRAGVELCLRRVLVRDPAKGRSVEIDPKLITTDPSDLLDDP